MRDIYFRRYNVICYFICAVLKREKIVSLQVFFIVILIFGHIFSSTLPPLFTKFSLYCIYVTVNSIIFSVGECVYEFYMYV